MGGDSLCPPRRGPLLPVTRAGRGPIASDLMDMDGVVVPQDHPVPGADRFVARLVEAGKPSSS